MDSADVLQRGAVSHPRQVDNHFIGSTDNRAGPVRDQSATRGRRTGRGTPREQ